MGSPEGGGISGAAAGAVSRGGIDVLNATVSLGRVSAPLAEGPVGANILNTMDTLAKPISPMGEIMFNPEAKVPHHTASVTDVDLPSGPEAVDIVEHWLGIPRRGLIAQKPRTIEVNNIEPLASATKPVDLLWKQPEVLPFSYPEPVVRSGHIELSKSPPHNVGLTKLDKRSAQENLVGQIVVSETPTFGEKEEIEELRLKNLLDEEVAQQRVYEIGKAIDLAKAEAEKDGVGEIEGWRIVKFLPPEHAGNRSQIVKERGPDGSLSETLEELAARKFSSKNQAKEQSKEIVARKEPVKWGKEGKTVREGAVERVFKYHLVNRSPKEEVVRRVIRKATLFFPIDKKDMSELK